MSNLNVLETSLSLADLVEASRDTIRARLVEIQKELDEIGPTFGMQVHRNELTREKNALLDELIHLRHV
jgi:hypothetical protein